MFSSLYKNDNKVQKKSTIKTVNLSTKWDQHKKFIPVQDKTKLGHAVKDFNLIPGKKSFWCFDLEEDVKFYSVTATSW